MGRINILQISLYLLVIFSIFSVLACSLSLGDMTNPITEQVVKVVDYQELETGRSVDWEFFTIEKENYLVVANYCLDVSNATIYNIQSIIYKWNDNTFCEWQKIDTNGAFDWEYFSIAGEHYLAVANHYNDENTHPYTIASYILKWDGSKFNSVQNISTDGALDWEYFSINGEHYLAVANYYNDVGRYKINSEIFKWDGHFVSLQNMPTVGARDWEYFSIAGEHYLAVANHYDDILLYNVPSCIYKYNQENAKFDLHQSIATYGARDWEYFSIDDAHFLFMANQNDGTNINVQSKIYRWDGQFFVFYQNIDSKGATDGRYFSVNKQHFLAVAEKYDYEKQTYFTESAIYRWDGSRFINHQTINTIGASDWEYFSIDSQPYLALANYGPNTATGFFSKIFVINIE